MASGASHRLVAICYRSMTLAKSTRRKWFNAEQSTRAKSWRKSTSQDDLSC
jgi:hypothetical protein